jgi:hypothetical protein
MLWLLRQVVAILVLPLNVAVVIPVWLARRNGTELALSSGVGQVALQALGLVLLRSGSCCSARVSAASCARGEERWPPGIPRGDWSCVVPTGMCETP